MRAWRLGDDKRASLVEGCFDAGEELAAIAGFGFDEFGFEPKGVESGDDLVHAGPAYSVVEEGKYLLLLDVEFGVEILGHVEGGRRGANATLVLQFERKGEEGVLAGLDQGGLVVEAAGTVLPPDSLPSR